MREGDSGPTSQIPEMRRCLRDNHDEALRPKSLPSRELDDDSSVLREDWTNPQSTHTSRLLCFRRTPPQKLQVLWSAS